MIALALLLAAVEWTAVLPSVDHSVARIEIKKGENTGVCSAVVLRADATGFGLAASAAHCFDREPTEKIDVTVNGRNGVVVASNSILDLALVRFRVRDERPIDIAPKSPEAGADVAILGYAFAQEEMVAQFGRVALNLAKDKKVLLIDGMIAFGDSGGPSVDAEGRLIGINSHVRFAGLGGQMAHLAGIVPIEAVRDFLDDYDDQERRKSK